MFMQFTELDSPCLLVDPAVVKKNIQEMIRMVGDVDQSASTYQNAQDSRGYPNDDPCRHIKI